MYHHRLRIIIYTAIVLLTSVKSIAQLGYYKVFLHIKDSLVKELGKHPLQDTARALALFSILDNATFLSEKKEVTPYWEEAMQLSRKLKYIRVEAASLEWRGIYYKSAQKPDSAIIYFDSAIQLAGNAPEQYLRRIKGFALFQKGMIYENQENLYTSLNYYFESLKSYDSSEFRKQIKVLLRAASIYQELHNDEKALDYYIAALKLNEKINDKDPVNETEGVNTLIAGIYFNRGELTKASFYLDKLKASMPDTVETSVTAAYYHLAGQIALKEKKTDSSITLLKEALKYYSYTIQMHRDGTANVCADIARLQMENNNMTEAKKYAEQSIASANESGHKQTKVDALTVLAEYYSKTGNQSGAYQVLLQATVLNDSLLDENNIKQAATLAAVYENSNKEKEIKQLESDKKMQSADVRQKTLLITIFLITIMALLLLSAMTHMNFKSKQKIERQKIAELEKEKQLMGIEAMLKGQEEERTRLAKDLHDGLGGMLSSVKISFSNMKENLVMDDSNAKTFERSLLQLDETIAELRKVAHNLMPEALVKFGLTSAVKDFCASMQLSGGVKIICEQFGIERELGNIADVNVYRIIQELVNNAVMHGNASQILVQLTKAAGKVLITIEDNGKGFEPSSPVKSKGIGLTNVRSRVNYFNGFIDIDSKPQEGTNINIELIT